jgi:hypothetical protein
VDTTESSAPHAHPSTEDHDDTVEAHYACLERPHACMDGWVFLGRVVESEHDLDGESSSTSACPAAVAQLAHANLRRMGDGRFDHPPFPPRYLPLQRAAWPFCCL